MVTGFWITHMRRPASLLYIQPATRPLNEVWVLVTLCTAVREHFSAHALTLKYGYDTIIIKYSLKNAVILFILTSATEWS